MLICGPNELLAYAFDAYHRNNADDLGNVILNFYDDVAVRTSKTLIWEKYGDNLHVWKDRRNTVGNPRNAKEKEVSDVVMAIRTINEKFSDVDELQIIFVAIKMKNLSDRGDISELSVRNCLGVLEAQMSEMLVDRATHIAIARAEIAMYAATARDGHMPPPVNVAIRRSDRNIAGHSLPVVEHSRRTPGVLPDVRNAITEAINIPDDNATPHTELPGNPNQARLNTRTMYNDDEVSGNESAFRTIQRRLRCDRAVFGTGEDDALSAGLQRHDLFVFQINKESIENDIKSYLERRGVTVINVERKSGTDAPSNSYHVEVHCLDVRTILTPGFWPVGVGSRKYYKKRTVNRINPGF